MTALIYSANNFSFYTVLLALRELGYEVSCVDSFHPTKSGSWQVTYTNTCYEKCSTFISVKVLLKIRVTLTIERAKNVVFTTVTHKGALTESGHYVTLYGCSCQDYHSDYGIRVNGSRVCKHTIAYSKNILGFKNFSEMVRGKTA